MKMTILEVKLLIYLCVRDLNYGRAELNYYTTTESRRTGDFCSTIRMINCMNVICRYNSFDS